MPKDKDERYQGTEEQQEHEDAERVARWILQGRPDWREAEEGSGRQVWVHSEPMDEGRNGKKGVSDIL